MNRYDGDTVKKQEREQGAGSRQRQSANGGDKRKAMDAKPG
jgi:hypothetical protein